jgi:hypothetical protein
MTPKERMIGLIQGKEIDQIPFVQYNDMNAKNEEIWREIGWNKMGVLEWVQTYRIETPNCKVVHEDIQEGELSGWRDTIFTPEGSLEQKRFLIPELNGPTGFGEHFVKREEDYQVLLAYLRDFQIIEDLSQIQNCHKKLGDGGIPHVSLPRTPYQALWIEWVSIEDLIDHLFGIPDLLNEVMMQLGKILLQALNVTAGVKKKAEFYHVTMGDNIHAPIIGKELFQKWCIPYYNTISDTLWEEGLPFIIHMDGDLKPIWGDIDRCRHRGFDSLSPPPDNDTSVFDALSRWPEKMVWANFPSSVHLHDQDSIYNKAMDLLTEGGHTRRFWIQISEDVPPGVWRKSFPPIIQAIEDFGKP